MIEDNSFLSKFCFWILYLCICICVFGSDTDIVSGQDKRSNVFKWILDLSWDWDGRVARVFSHIPNALTFHF